MLFLCAVFLKPPEGTSENNILVKMDPSSYW